MKTTAPEAFSMSFSGPEGVYTVDFTPTDEWDGIIEVSINGHAMRWHVVNVELEDDGSICLGGSTAGSHEIWNRSFWFDLRINDVPPVIRYWGDRIILREDKAADLSA